MLLPAKLVAGGARGQRGIVRDDRAGAGDDGVGHAPDLVAFLARQNAGDPFAVAAAGRDASVKRHGGLGDNVRAFGAQRVKPGAVKLARLALQHARAHAHAAALEARRAASRKRMRIGDRIDDLGDAPLEQSLRAWRRASLVVARLEELHRRALHETVLLLPQALRVRREEGQRLCASPRRRSGRS